MYCLVFSSVHQEFQILHHAFILSTPELLQNNVYYTFPWHMFVENGGAQLNLAVPDINFQNISRIKDYKTRSTLFEKVSRSRMHLMHLLRIKQIETIGIYR